MNGIISLFLTLASTGALNGGENPPAARMIVENSHIRATIEHDEKVVRIPAMGLATTDPPFLFQPSDPFQIVAVTLEEAADPGLVPEYAFAGVYQLRDFTVSGADLIDAVYSGPLIDVTVRYEIAPGSRYLRKSLKCTAHDKAAVIAGARLWCLAPQGSEIAWPSDGALGQPVVLTQGEVGCFITLEWPRALYRNENNIHCLEYRPHIVLNPGDSVELVAGSLQPFAKEYAGQSVLDAARQAFFDHVTSRVNPEFPFPVKYTTWGPWLAHADAPRILRIVDDMEYVGTDLFHFDAGWQQNLYPYSEHYLKLQGASAEEWDLRMTNSTRLPGGLLPIKAAVEQHGMKLSLWFDACASVFMRETGEWAAHDAKGAPVYSNMWENKTEMSPRLSLASEYGGVLTSFIGEMRERYNLGGVMFDNNHYPLDQSLNRECLANGWNSEDSQMAVIMNIFDEANRSQPGFYRFYCNGAPWAWSLLHATHIHGGDPGTTDTMKSASGSDYPARALAYERRRAWQHYYNNFVPPWGVKGDIAGWSVQQRSPIPLNLDHTDRVIECGEGWVQNLFTCFAVTSVRDIRFAFDQMPTFDRDILKEWLAWDRGRSHYITRLRPVRIDLDNPNEGACVFSQAGNGEGVLYAFNQSFQGQTLQIKLDETTGFKPGDQDLSAYLVYPMKAPVQKGRVSYGDTLSLPLIGKDCAVIEIGLPPPADPVEFPAYEKQASSVIRDFKTRFITSEPTVLEMLTQKSIAFEVGSINQDRILARQILDAVSALRGEALDFDEITKKRPESADVRVIIGTYEGLKENRLVKTMFRETLYDRFVEWDGQLISAPLAVVLKGAHPKTLCLMAPRPEQLARLAKDLAALVNNQASMRAPIVRKGRTRSMLRTRFMVPSAGKPALAFRPVVLFQQHLHYPNDLPMLQFELWAECDGERKLIWSDAIAPFHVLGGEPWWEDRFVSLAGYAGRKIGLEARVTPDMNSLYEFAEVGFQEFYLLNLE